MTKRGAITRGLGVAVLIVFLLGLGNHAATTVRADPSTMSWDVAMDDPSSGGVCDDTNAGNGLIEEGECPDVSPTYWIQPEGGSGGLQSWTDLASLIWTTDPMGVSDVTGDTIPDATGGLVPNRPSTIGAKVGELAFSITSGLSLGLTTSANIDDVGGNNTDPSVVGQPLPCGAAATLVLVDGFEVWNAIIDGSNGTVSHKDLDLNGTADTRDPMDSTVDPTNFPTGYPAGCDGTPGKECAPRGVVQMPEPVPGFVTSLGFPAGSDVMRGFGVAKLPIVAGITSDLDITVLEYALHDTGSDVYIILVVPGYIGPPAADPNGPTYDPLGQTVITCPPYYNTTTIAGVTADPDFDEDGNPDLSVTPEINNLIVGGAADYMYILQASTTEDYDGDTIPGYADRCDTDPATGTTGDDTDGDTITGTCETTGAGNTEGVNPGAPGAFGGTVATFTAGQDVDGDTYLNLADNCPQVADRDLDADTIVDFQYDTDGDAVGDVCEIDLGAAGSETVPGDGSGYPNPAPGMLVDNLHTCSDVFTIGEAEPAGEAGDISRKSCLGPGMGAATVPYANPAPAVLRLSGFRDADNDGTPDFWDGTGSACSNDPTWCPGADPNPYDYFDVDDEDLDGHSDACESFQGFDSLDASSTPGAPSITDDCDGDTTSDADELDANTNPLDGIESDGDGFCSDAEETAKSLDPTKWYDFFDVPVPARADPEGNGVRNGAISIGDVLAVLFYAGAANDGVANGNGVDYDSDKNVDGVEDGVDYDRTPTTPPIPPGPPDGAISISDVLAALAQSGTSCPAKGSI